VAFLAAIMTLNRLSSVLRAIVGCSRLSASSMMRLSSLMRKLVKRMASVPVWKLSIKWRMSYHGLLDTCSFDLFEPGSSISTQCVLVLEGI
jgi:hypothetical protein